MQKFFWTLFFSAAVFSACNFLPTPSTGNEVLPLYQDTLSAEEVVIAVELKEHQTHLLQPERKEGKLPHLGVNKIEAWWDSLPNQIQEKIKEQQVDIEVVATLNPREDSVLITDEHIVEETGEMIEQVVGGRTNLRYTLNTQEQYDSKSKLQASTIIKLREHVAVKLNSFDVQIFFREKKVSNENMLSLQYWWLNLPIEIQDKIRKRELLVQLDAIVVEQFLDAGANQQDIPVEDNLRMFLHSLNNIIGVQPFINIAVPLASVRTKIIYRKMDEQTLLYPAAQSVGISLHKNNRIQQTSF